MTPTKSKMLTTLVASIVLTSGCQRALVYGDRTGFNLAVRTDPAKADILEVNTGLQREVVGFVPPQAHTADGNADGEAVNMISRTDIRRTRASDGNPFNDNIKIHSAFISGAATVEAPENSKLIRTVIDAPKFVQTADAADRAVNTKLLNFTSQGTEQALRYLGEAKTQGLTISVRSEPIASAFETIVDPRNSVGNRRILSDLNL